MNQNEIEAMVDTIQSLNGELFTLRNKHSIMSMEIDAAHALLDRLGVGREMYKAMRIPTPDGAEELWTPPNRTLTLVERIKRALKTNPQTLYETLLDAEK